MGNKNNYISVAYKLYVRENDETEETMIEEVQASKPLVFITNMGVSLAVFEDNIINVNKGETFDFVISPKDGFGEYDDTLVISIPKSRFFRNGNFDKENIFEGNVITLQNPEGETMNAIVLEVKDDVVVLDLNHPHAGLYMHFVGTMLENREATVEEVAGFANMLGGGCGNGCGGGCHGGGCQGGGCEGGCDNDGGCGGGCCGSEK